MTEKLDLDHLRQWIGRTQEATDIVTAQLVKGLRATLFHEVGEPKDGDAAPSPRIGAWRSRCCRCRSSARRPPHPRRVPAAGAAAAANVGGGEIEFLEPCASATVDAHIDDHGRDDEDRLDRAVVLRLRRPRVDHAARRRDPRATTSSIAR